MSKSVWMDNIEFDFLRCEDEPIHIPSKIQPFGYFFTIDKDSKTILAASDNLALLGVAFKDIFGKNILSFYPEIEPLLQDFKECLHCSGRKSYFDQKISNLSDERVDVFISSLNNHVVVEFIQKDLQNRSQEGINYQDVLNDLINTQSLDAVYEKVVQNIKA
ncbi:MAG: hypothetical protein ACQESH_08780, partial [Campylobacterota bacterium]